MSAIDNMRKRLNYGGGIKQQGRMNNDKLYALKKALLYSYQAATAVLADGREFRCLINPDKIKKDYDNKYISIPFNDICLNKPRVGKTTEGLELIGMKPGDVFQWKENGSYWIVYLPRLEETAYFRAEIRRCAYDLDVDGTDYKVYVRGPVETTIPWFQKAGLAFNEINYSLVMTITKNEQTEAFFHRFKKVKFLGQMWEVQTVDSISTEGIIDIYLKEYYNNSIKEAAEAEQKENIPEVQDPQTGIAAIIGDEQVYPYENKIFTIKNSNNGIWYVDNNKVDIVAQNSSQVELNIVTGKSGKFNLYYKTENGDIIAEKQVVILSL